MPIYDPSGHPRLSAAAQALDTAPAGTPDALDAEADAAEVELGLAGTAYTGAEYERARLAVVLWINCQLTATAHGGSQAVGLKSESKGDQSFTYATAKEDDTNPCSRARAIVAGLSTPVTTGAAQRPVSRSVPNQYSW